MLIAMLLCGNMKGDKMRVLRVIVDEMPNDCNQECPFECDWQCRAHDWEQLYAEDFGKIPSWCQLEVETDGWIAASERLPEPTYLDYGTQLKSQNMYLVMCDNNRIELYAYVKYGIDKQYRSWVDAEGCFMPNITVTHWRPLFPKHRRR